MVAILAAITALGKWPRGALFQAVDAVPAPVGGVLFDVGTIDEVGQNRQRDFVVEHAFQVVAEVFLAVGVHDQATFDLWSAMLTGLTDQQISNDAGCDRWIQLVDPAIDLLLADTANNVNQQSEQP